MLGLQDSPQPGDSSDLEKKDQYYELIRPDIEFPESFEVSISTDEYGLNITEHIYYDKVAKKVRIQLFYGVLGLEASKGFDVVFDEANQIVALQSDNDCKQTFFGDSLLPLNLFFNMFNQLTQYKGSQDGFHLFKIKKLYENDNGAPNFYFIFDQNK
jgi:hypothetical protein